MTMASTASQHVMATNHHAQRSAVLGQQPKVVMEMMPTIVNRVATLLHTQITMHISVSRIVQRGLLQMTTMTVLRALRMNTQTMKHTNASKPAALAVQVIRPLKIVSSVAATLRTLITLLMLVSQNVQKVKLELLMISN
jgi:hypothetical protein